MTRVTFVASSFAANSLSGKMQLTCAYPLATKVFNNSFYVDAGLTGADSTMKAIEFQKRSKIFSQGGFLLRK